MGKMGGGGDYMPPPQPSPEAPTVDDVEVQAAKEGEQRRRVLAAGMEDEDKTNGQFGTPNKGTERKPTLLGG